MTTDTKTMTTYRRADGELIGGEYGWVADTDFFDDEEDYLEVVEEVWTLASTRTLKFGPLSRWCDTCDEDIELKEPVNGPVFCSHQCALEAKAEGDFTISGRDSR